MSRDDKGWTDPNGQPFVALRLDHASGCVWYHDGSSGEPASLPLDPALVARIERWTESYFVWDRDNNPAGPVPECLPNFPFETFDREGEAIAAAVRAALPGWTVVHHRCWRPGGR